MKDQQNPDKQPMLLQIKDTMIGIVPGESGAQVEIRDVRALDELKTLIEKRRAIGVEISRRLRETGLVSAGEDDPTKVG